jgi:MoxR-like ATPase
MINERTTNDDDRSEQVCENEIEGTSGMSEADTETLSKTVSITESLGVRGWGHLDAVLLAALATESPLLLVGPHGAAKSLLVERVARAQGLTMRHYNAALLNYDDLVGIPLPDETGTTLRFVTTPGTIWDAGFVFFDEISRCRADLQNKLFPIIYERRVVGINLDNLRHRWAAMNPPAPDDPAAKGTSDTYYLGSEPLDPALTDRFPFILTVPAWGELSRADRLELVRYANNGHFGYQPQHDLDLPGLVARCAALIPELEAEAADWLGDYIVCAVDLFEQVGLAQSPRRARTLARNVIAIHAARLLLHGPEADIEDSAEIAMLYGLPQNATDVPPSPVKVVATHKQAWEMAQYLEDEKWRQVMQESDKARRVALADHLGFSDEALSKLITQTIGAEDSDARQVGLAVAMFLAFRGRRNLDPSAFEPLAQLAYHVLEPRQGQYMAAPNTPEAALWDDIKDWADNAHQDTFLFRLQRNYVLHGFPNLWRTQSWREALEAFQHDLILFGIEEARES